MDTLAEDKLYLLQDVMAAYNSGGVDHLFDENIVYHVPGFNLISGTHNGRTDVNQMLAEARKHYLQNPYTTKLMSVSSSDHHIAIRTLREASVGKDPVKWTQTTLFFVQQGMITEVWVFADNKEAFNLYWSL